MRRRVPCRYPSDGQASRNGAKSVGVTGVQEPTARLKGSAVITGVSYGGIMSMASDEQRRKPSESLIANNARLTASQHYPFEFYIHQNGWRWYVLSRFGDAVWNEAGPFFWKNSALKLQADLARIA